MHVFSFILQTTVHPFFVVAVFFWKPQYFIFKKENIHAARLHGLCLYWSLPEPNGQKELTGMFWAFP